MKAIQYFLRADHENFVFPIFSQEHLILLSVVATVALLLVISSPALRKSRFNNLIRYGIVTILIVHRIIRFTYYMASGQYTIQEYLPLHICHVGTFACIIALITRNRKAFSLAYFWGFIGGIVGILTPDIGYQNWPHITFFLFFTQHVIMPYGVLFLLFVDQMRPSSADLRFVLKFSLFFSSLMVLFNSLTGANYLYLREKPISGSILDMLPSYPYYVPLAIVLFLVYLLLAYVPFCLAGKLSGANSVNSQM